MKRFISLVFVGALLINGCSYKQDYGKRIIDNNEYVVVDVTTSDPAEYDRWLALEEPILKKFGAYIIMDVRNADQTERRIVVAFPDHETIEHFVASPEFKKILPMNIKIAKTKVFHGKLF